MNWLNNAWVVGIGTGIVSGLLVYWLLSLFLSKKKDREHQQQISTANREVIYSIRSSIPEDSLPTHDVVEALIHSTARKYDVESAELYQPLEITEELIKEVMDSSFLSSAKKVEYCAALFPLCQRTSDTGFRMIDISDPRVENFRAQMRNASLLREARNASALSLVIGMLTAITTSLFVTVKLSPSIETKVHLLGKSIGGGIALSLIIAAIVPILFESVKKLAWLANDRERSKQNDIGARDSKNLKGDT